jgi:hypothetical protein
MTEKVAPSSGQKIAYFIAKLADALSKMSIKQSFLSLLNLGVST